MMTAARRREWPRVPDKQQIYRSEAKAGIAGERRFRRLCSCRIMVRDDDGLCGWKGVNDVHGVDCV